MAPMLNATTFRHWLRVNAVRKGLLGQDRRWLVVLALGIVARVAGQAMKRGPMPVVFSEKLEPGAALVITHLEHAGKSRRRRRSS
jgi:hypothetical protein